MNNKSKPTMEFEFVEPNRILLKENGRVIEEETLDYKAYEIFVHDTSIRMKKLIPTAYYRFMKMHQPVSYSQENWDSTMAEAVGTKITDVLFPFQREAIYRMIKQKRCMNACSPGLGKSIQALSALSYYNNKTSNANDLIVCPSYLTANWMNEVKKWLPESIAETAVVISKAGKKEIDGATNLLLKTPGIKIISYDLLSNILGKYSGGNGTGKYFNTVVLDESHFIKDGKTTRFKNVAKYIRTSKQMYLLTGTPSPNRNKELYTQFHLIQPSVFYQYDTFAFRYCDAKYDKFNRFDDKGASNVKELSFIMSMLAIRLRREDHIDELPSVMREKVIIQPPTISKRFMTQKKKFLDELNNIDDNESAVFKVQSMASEMFRLTATIKEKPVVDYLKGYIEDTELEKTILFCKHQSMLGAVTNFLQEAGMDFIEISGQTDKESRTKLIAKFLNDPGCMFAALTTGTCATGLNIVPVRRMIFLELEWSPSTLDQCEARINRIGGAKNLHYIYLICDHTLDSMVFRKLEKKTALITDVVDSSKNYGDFEFTHQSKRQKTS